MCAVIKLWTICHEYLYIYIREMLNLRNLQHIIGPGIGISTPSTHILFRPALLAEVSSSILPLSSPASVMASTSLDGFAHPRQRVIKGQI